MSIRYFTDAIEIAQKHNDDYAILFVAQILATTYNKLEDHGGTKALATFQKNIWRQ
jgi:hypothetical protein